MSQKSDTDQNKIEFLETLINVIDWFPLENFFISKEYRLSDFEELLLIQHYVLSFLTVKYYDDIFLNSFGNKTKSNTKVIKKYLDLLIKPLYDKCLDEDVGGHCVKIQMEDYKCFIDRNNLSHSIQNEVLKQLRPYIIYLDRKLSNNYISIFRNIEPLDSQSLNQLLSMLNRMFENQTLRLRDDIVNKKPKLWNKRILLKKSIIILSYSLIQSYCSIKICASLLTEPFHNIKFFTKYFQKKLFFNFTNILGNRAIMKQKIVEIIKSNRFLIFLIEFIHRLTCHVLIDSEKELNDKILDKNLISFPRKKMESIFLLLKLTAKISFSKGYYHEVNQCIKLLIYLDCKISSKLIALGALSAFLSLDYRIAEAYYRISMIYGYIHNSRLLGLSLLAQGKEAQALKYIDRAIRLDPQVSMPHQNLAARKVPSQYVQQILDFERSPMSILYDNYNFLGELAIHAGNGQLGMLFFSKALKQQLKLRELIRLPDDLGRILKRDYSINYNETIRILPEEWITQIGHIALLDSYIRMQKLGIIESGKNLILAPKNKVINQIFLNLWRPYVTIIAEPKLIEALSPYQRAIGSSFNACMDKDKVVREWTKLAAYSHKIWDFKDKDHLIHIPNVLKQKGNIILNKMGIKESDWFVTIHIRTGLFHSEGNDSVSNHRNSDIADYRGAIEFITSQGGWVIRVGDKHTDDKINNERYIDYPNTSYKSESMDIFLASEARFFIGTTSGLANVVMSLGTPCLFVNCISNYYQLFNDKVIFMVKPLWDSINKRYLKFSEMMNESFRWNMFNNNCLKRQAITPLNNTYEEIQAGTEEIYNRLAISSRFNHTIADRALNLECKEASNIYYYGNGRLSETFYRKWANTLFLEKVISKRNNSLTRTSA